MRLIIRILTFPFKVLAYPFKLLPDIPAQPEDPRQASIRSFGMIRNQQNIQAQIQQTYQRNQRNAARKP